MLCWESLPARQTSSNNFINDILGVNKAQKNGFGVTRAEALDMLQNKGNTRVIDIFIKNGKLDQVLTSIW